jgi:hypothetical protein
MSEYNKIENKQDIQCKENKDLTDGVGRAAVDGAIITAGAAIGGAVGGPVGMVIGGGIAAGGIKARDNVQEKHGDVIDAALMEAAKLSGEGMQSMDSDNYYEADHNNVSARSNNEHDSVHDNMHNSNHGNSHSSRDHENNDHDHGGSHRESTSGFGSDGNYHDSFGNTYGFRDIDFQ